MSKLSTPADYEDVEQEGRPSRILRALPYLIILILTLVGVAYTSINKQPLVHYWEVVAVLTGGLVRRERLAPRRKRRPGQARLDAGSSLGGLPRHHEFSALQRCAANAERRCDRASDPSSSCAWNLCCWRSHLVMADWGAWRGDGACGSGHRLDRGVGAHSRSCCDCLRCIGRHFLVVRAKPWLVGP